MTEMIDQKEVNQWVLDYQEQPDGELFEKIFDSVKRFLMFRMIGYYKFLQGMGGGECWFQLDREDIRQDSILVCLNAIKSWRPDMGTNFFTYVINGVLRANRLFENYRLIRIPLNWYFTQNADKSVSKEYKAKHGGPAMSGLLYLEELQRRGGGSERVVTWQGWLGRTEKSQFDDYSNFRYLARKIRGKINPRWWRVLKLRLKGYTLQEIAELFGVTRERIRQLEKHAIDCAIPIINERLEIVDEPRLIETFIVDRSARRVVDEVRKPKKRPTRRYVRSVRGFRHEVAR